MKPQMTMYSLILAWDEDVRGHGTFAWSGEAETYERAVIYARLEGLADSWPEGDDRDVEDILKLTDEEVEKFLDGTSAPTNWVINCIEGYSTVHAMTAIDSLVTIVNQMADTSAWEDAMEGRDDNLKSDMETAIRAINNCLGSQAPDLPDLDPDWGDAEAPELA